MVFYTMTENEMEYVICTTLNLNCWKLPVDKITNIASTI